jgi:hypothetical protein
MNDVLKTAADGPLLVILGIQNDGAVYALYPLSKDRIWEHHPGLELPRSIFLGHYKEKDFERLNRPRWERMMVLLTGLEPEELMRLGGGADLRPGSGTNCMGVAARQAR